MTRDEIIARFNPSADPNFTPEELEVLRKLTDEDIEALAAAYPNQPARKSYLRLYDTNIKQENKQIFSPSTWQNIRNLRKYSNIKNLIPWDFMTTQATKRLAARPPQRTVPAAKRVVIDMSAQEAADELARSIKQKQPKKDDPKAVKKTVEAIKSVQKNNPPKPAKKAAQNIPADQDFTDPA